MAILNTDIKNANIKFLNGLQSDLNTLITNGGAVKGAFYLTSDTHRLYIGQEDNNRTDLTAGAQRVVPVPLNEGVTTVARVSALPSAANVEAGAFYYATQENILCVHNGNTWVQINPDTNTTIDYFYHNIVTDTTKTRLTSNLRDNNGNEISARVDFIGANGISITSDSDPSFTGTTYNANASKVITITGDSYGLSNSINAVNNTTTITLASSDTNKSPSSVNIIGKDNITFENDNGDIAIKATNTFPTNIGITNRANSANGFTVSALLNNGNTVDSTFDPIIHFDVDGGADYHFVNGTANLPLYTKQEIDLVLRQLNSMVYKGIVGYGQIMTAVPDGRNNTDSSGNIRRVSVGDTYKIGASGANSANDGFNINTGSSSTATVYMGDLIIAQGTEYTESNYPSGHPELIGTIDPDLLYWGYIPSGNDETIETTYAGRAVQHGIKLTSSGGIDVAEFKVLGDNTYISVSDAQSVSGSGTNIPNNQTVTVQHNLVDTATYSDNTIAVTDNTTQIADRSMTLPIITNIQRDAAGHVLKVTTTNYSVVDSNVDVKTYQTTTSSDNTKTYSKVSTELTLQNDLSHNEVNTIKNTDFVIESSTMEVSSGTKTIGTDTFNSVTMELVWGSFTATP